MKTTAALLLASAAAASAQVTYDSTTNTWTCPQPGQAYCAGTSGKTDIIIRCGPDGKGQPGRCTDNLAGQPPLGVQSALCFQPSETSGQAACEKNCVIYGGSGNFPGTSTLPAAECTPYYTASTSAQPTTTITYDGTSGSWQTATPVTLTTQISVTDTVTSCTKDKCHMHTAPPPPVGTGGSGSNPPPSNGTVVTPTNPPTSLPTAGAALNRAGAGLAALGLAAAYLL